MSDGTRVYKTNTELKNAGTFRKESPGKGKRRTTSDTFMGPMPEMKSPLFRGLPALRDALGGKTVFLQGNQGAHILRLQQALVLLGSLSSVQGNQKVDNGFFGPRTHDAVVDFQRRWGLSRVDGRVGSETLGALDEMLAGISLTVREKSEYSGHESVALFRNALKYLALQRLRENYRELAGIEKQYRTGTVARSSSPHWKYLKMAMAEDRVLAMEERSLKEKKGVHEHGMQSLTMGGYHPENDPAALVFDENLKALREIRSYLRVQYPVLAVINTVDISENAPVAELYENIRNSFSEIRQCMRDVAGRIESGDIPLERLGVIVEEVKQKLGISEEREKNDHALSSHVNSWLTAQNRKELIISIGGLVASIGLGVGALLATGGATLVLGALGAAVGFAGAAYDFEIYSDLNDMARSQRASRKKFMTEEEAEKAKFNYVMGWINLVMAGIDAGGALRGGSVFLKGTRTAKDIAGVRGLEVFAGLKTADIVELDRAFELRQLGRYDEAEAMLAGLRKRLGGDVVDRVDEVVNNNIAGVPARKAGAESLPDISTPLKKKGITYAPLKTSGHSVRLQNSLTESLRPGEIVGVRSRPPGSYTTERWTNFRTKPSGDVYVGESRVATGKKDAGLRAIELEDGTKEYVISDLDLAFLTDGRGRLLSEDYIENTYGRAVNQRYNRIVVNHGDNVHGVLKGNEKAIEIAKKPDIIYIYNSTGLIDQGTYKKMVEKYVKIFQ